MADWTHLHRDASNLGGLLYWPIEIVEGRDLLIELPGVVYDDEDQPYDFTACSEPVAQIVNPDTEAVVANLTWTPRADGTFGFTGARIDLTTAAGAKQVEPNGRGLEWACKVTIPGGFHVQLVGLSPVVVRHKGVS